MSDCKCRLCLISLGGIIDIFSEEAAHLKVAEKLDTFCHIKVSETDNAPRTICFTCLSEVNRFADFYKRVQDNQKLLELTWETKTEEEIAPEKEDQKKEEFINKADDRVQKKNEQKPLESFEILFIDEDAEDIKIKANLNDGDAITSTDSESEEIVQNDHDYVVIETAPSPGPEQFNSLVHFENEPQPDNLNDVDAITSTDSESEEIVLNDHNYVVFETTTSPEPEQFNSVVHFEIEPQPDNNSECETSKNEERLVNQTHRSKGQANRKQRYIALDKPIRDFFGLRCDRCQKEFQTFQSLRIHMNSQHDERFFFACCDKKLYRRDAVMEHIDSHLDPNKFMCDVCDQVCKSKITLKVHMKQHIPKDQRPFPCEKCGDRFALKSQLKSHMNSHLSDEEKRFVCNECGKAFAFNFVLEKHKKNMHIRHRNYMCEICARSFIDKVNLTAHKRTHVMAPRLQCPECNALLKTSKTLKIHMLIHNPSTKNQLPNHIKYAHTNKKYPCETCGRVFKKALNLKEHMSIHTGEILYECEYCDKTFNAKANRYAHTKKIHTDEWAIKQKLRRRSD